MTTNKVITKEEMELFSKTVNCSSFIVHKDERFILKRKKKDISLHSSKLVYDTKIDLHGLTVKQAEVSVKFCISRCVVKKIKKLLIIHGKGSGILRNEIRNFLTKNPKVVSIKEMPNKVGGSGVVLAILRIC